MSRLWGVCVVGDERGWHVLVYPSFRYSFKWGKIMKTFVEDLAAAPEVTLQLTNDLIRIQCVRI